VRSARNSDTWIVPAYDALFFYSGANDKVIEEIAAADMDALDPNTAWDSSQSSKGVYHRVSYRSAPHNYYLDLGRCYERAEEVGFSSTTDAPRTLEFALPDADFEGAAANIGEIAETWAGEGYTPEGENAWGTGAWGEADLTDPVEATELTVTFSTGFVSSWLWDADQQAYLRSFGGSPTLDADGDVQVAAQNVVVLWAVHKNSIIANGQTLNIYLTDWGYASVFTNGMRIDGTWETDGTTPPRFRDRNGNTILLTPGQTWFQVINYGQKIESAPLPASVQAAEDAEAGA